MAGTVTKKAQKQPTHLTLSQTSAIPKVGQVASFGGIVHRLTPSPSGKLLHWVPIGLEAS